MRRVTLLDGSTVPIDIARKCLGEIIFLIGEYKAEMQIIIESVYSVVAGKKETFRFGEKHINLGQLGVPKIWYDGDDEVFVNMFELERRGIISNFSKTEGDESPDRELYTFLITPYYAMMLKNCLDLEQAVSKAPEDRDYLIHDPTKEQEFTKITRKNGKIIDKDIELEILRMYR